MRTNPIHDTGGTLFAAPRGIDRTVRARIRDWIRDVCDLPDGATLMVQELRCLEPECPDVETVVLLGMRSQGSVRYRVAKPAAEVTRDDIATAIQNEEDDR